MERKKIVIGHTQLTSRNAIHTPKAVREALGLKRGDWLCYRVNDNGEIVIVKAELPSE